MLTLGLVLLDISSIHKDSASALLLLLTSYTNIIPWASLKYCLVIALNFSCPQVSHTVSSAPVEGSIFIDFTLKSAFIVQE